MTWLIGWLVTHSIQIAAIGVTLNAIALAETVVINTEKIIEK